MIQHGTYMNECPDCIHAQLQGRTSCKACALAKTSGAFSDTPYERTTSKCLACPQMTSFDLCDQCTKKLRNTRVEYERRRAA